MPQADSTDATVGTMMRLISSSRATSAACKPAAPPKLSSANFRGSTPRRKVIRRMPSAIFRLIMRQMAATARASHRAGASGANAKRMAGTDAGDRSAAGRDAGDTEAAQRDALARQHAVGGQRGLPARDQRNVGRGATHVERHQIGNPDQ